MRNNKKKHILIDFDGVIVDSWPFTFAIAKTERPHITEESYRKLYDGNIYEALKKEYPDESEEVKRAREQNFFTRERLVFLIRYELGHNF